MFLLGAVGYVLFLAYLGAIMTGPSSDGGLDELRNVAIAVVVGWNLVVLVVAVLVLVDSVLKIRAGRTRQLATGVFLVKLVAIPFYLVNYALMLLVVVGVLALSIHAIGIFLIPFVTPIVVVGTILTYVLLLSTSIYGWAALARMRRERTIGTGLTVLYALLLLVFVVDIAVAVMLFGHSRRRAGTALVVLLLTVGAMLVALWAIPFVLGIDRNFDALAWIGIGGGVIIIATIAGALIRRSKPRRGDELETRERTIVDA